MVSDVDIGSYLSGGMDSGSITALASKKIDKLRTFTGGFDLNSVSGIELNFDERETAEKISYLFKTEQYEMVLKSGDMERSLPKLSYYLEEPRVGQSYPNFYISGLASKFNKVVLSGTGGDEIFAGYPWRYMMSFDGSNFDQFIDEYYKVWQRLIPNKEIKNFFSPIWNEVSNVWTRDIFANVFKNVDKDLTNKNNLINLSLYLEAKTFLHSLFVVEDKLSMSHSLETRVPFMDNDLVNFAMKIPVSLKLKKFDHNGNFDENMPGGKTAKYYQKRDDGKMILRKMMNKILPKEITEREKQGFSAPDASWFKGESSLYVKNLLFNNNAKIYEYLDFKSVKKLVNEHLNGKQNRRLLLWSLANVENMLKEYKL